MRNFTFCRSSEILLLSRKSLETIDILNSVEQSLMSQQSEWLLSGRARVGAGL